MVADIIDEDHPRACGENTDTLFLSHLKNGSPPRVRGKRCGAFSFRALPRITPARAGKTCEMRISALTQGDHPRACGENSRQARAACAGLGSPPRVRGKLHDAHKVRRPAGITPARAGKTLAVIGVDRFHGDHPRACGENCTSVGRSPPSGGSPPRVRGKRAFKMNLVTGERITPARAGKTSTEAMQKINAEDHPRACGENRTGTGSMRG